MRFTEFLILNILLFLSFNVFSQNTCTLTIKVLDEDSAELIRNASVSIDGPITETQTVEMGGAIFTTVSAGAYNIKVTAEGYNDKTGNITLDPAKKKDYSGTFRLQSLKSSKPKTAPPNKIAAPQASSVKLYIKLLDAESGDPLKTASVEIGGPNKQKKDTVNGMVAFDNVPDGSCAITVTAEGYEDKSGKIVIDAKKKSEYSGTLKLIKKKQAVQVLPEDTEKLKDIVADIKEDALKKIDENKPLLSKERSAPAPVPPSNISYPEDLTVKKQTAAVPPAAPQEKISASAPVALQISEKTWYAPFMKPVMIAASIFSSLLLIAFFLGLFIKWSEMTGMVKAVSGVGALGCGTLTFIIIVATVIICYSVQNDSASLPRKATEKAISRFDKVEEIFSKKASQEKPSIDIVLDDTASKHERGTMIFISAVKSNNAEDKEKGLAFLEEAFREEPGNMLYTLDLADAYVQMNTMLHMRLAQALYKGLLETAPENDKLLARTADTCARLYQYDKAFQFAARRAWSGKASPVEAASQIALISLLSGDFDRGISELVKIIRSGPPETAELRMILAGLYAENGKKEKAIEILDKLIASLPANNDLAIRAQDVKRNFVQ